VRAVLNVGIAPVMLSRGVIPFIEKHVESLKHERLGFFVWGLGHLILLFARTAARRFSIWWHIHNVDHNRNVGLNSEDIKVLQAIKPTFQIFFSKMFDNYDCDHNCKMLDGGMC
jgi:hypothetical protein